MFILYLTADDRHPFTLELRQDGLWHGDISTWSSHDISEWTGNVHIQHLNPMVIESDDMGLPSPSHLQLERNPNITNIRPVGPANHFFHARWNMLIEAH